MPISVLKKKASEMMIYDYRARLVLVPSCCICFDDAAAVNIAAMKCGYAQEYFVFCLNVPPL